MWPTLQPSPAELDRGQPSRRGRLPVVRRSSLLVLVALSLLGAACGDDETTRGPTLPTVDFTPSGALIVDEDGIACESTEFPDQCRVASGSVVEARNSGSTTHRLRSDVFDTGSLEPGDVTTIVVTAAGDFEVRDLARPTSTVVLTVEVR
jgi:hypothetical protein